MKPFLRLPVSAVALVAVFALGVGLTRAQDDTQARQAAATGLLSAMHTEKMVDSTLARMLNMVDRFHQSAVKQGTLTAEQSDAVQKAEDEARDTIRKELGFAALKSEFIQAYADAFSEQELKDLTTFYNSPLGQKLVEKQPVINEKLGLTAQQKTRTVMMGVVQKLQGVAQKNFPSPKMPATVTASPTGPSAPSSVVTPPVSVTPTTLGVPPVAATPSAVTSPVPVMPTPPPSPTAASTPVAQ